MPARHSHKAQRELSDFEHQIPWRLRHLALAMLNHGPVFSSRQVSLKLLNSEPCSAVSAPCDISHESELGLSTIKEAVLVGRDEPTAFFKGAKPLEPGSIASKA